LYRLNAELLHRLNAELLHRLNAELLYRLYAEPTPSLNFDRASSERRIVLPPDRRTRAA